MKQLRKTVVGLAAIVSLLAPAGPCWAANKDDETLHSRMYWANIFFKKFRSWDQAQKALGELVEAQLADKNRAQVLLKRVDAYSFNRVEQTIKAHQRDNSSHQYHSISKTWPLFGTLAEMGEVGMQAIRQAEDLQVQGLLGAQPGISRLQHKTLVYDFCRPEMIRIRPTVRVIP